MKKYLNIFCLILFIISFSVFTTSEFNTKRTLMIYFDNHEAQFTLLEISYMMNELKNYFASEEIFVYDINISKDERAMNLLEANGLVSYIEFTADLIGISGSFSNYTAETNISMRVYNTDTDEEFLDNIQYEGTAMATRKAAKALSLAHGSVEVIKKNLDQIKKTMQYE